MQIRSDHVTGFVVGLGVAAAGFYLYKKNQPQVDAFLRQHGIDVPAGAGGDVAAMTIDELVAEKERLEDLIAEREYAAAQEAAAAPAEEPSEPPPARPARKRSAGATKR